MPDIVRRADITMLATEKRDLLEPEPKEWKSLEGVKPMHFKIDPWLPARAEYAFLEQFERVRTK